MNFQRKLKPKLKTPIFKIKGNNAPRDDTPKQMDVYRFGVELLEKKDLDPVYTIVYQAGLDRSVLRRWLIAYWCFYHVGTASWVADAPLRRDDHTQFWRRMMIAAKSKDYPRCPERRHFRGDNATNSVEWLASLDVWNLFNPFDQAHQEGNWLSATKVMAWAKDWVGFGPWISFKVADMLDRVGYCRVQFTNEEALYDSPREGAAKMWAAEKKGQPDPKDIGVWAMDRLVKTFVPYKAPPRFDRVFGPPEAETVLCKWNSYLGGHYHVGEDVAGCKKGLQWREGPTAEKLYAAGKERELWS